MGKDKQPLDLSRDDHAGVFMRSLATWKGKMATNHDDSMYGYVDIERMDLEPYGTSYAEK